MFGKKITKATEIEVNTLRQRISNIADSLTDSNREITSLNNKCDKMNDMLVTMNKRIDYLYQIISKIS